jgi:hypothetical protein
VVKRKLGAPLYPIGYGFFGARRTTLCPDAT